MAQWKGDIEKPLVSICCITYNHEQYIEDALNGFLGQITDFPFEILINDDASTDNTPEIVRRYAEAYPKLIKAIYQTENKYSKGYMPNPSFNFPRAEGEFIAMCEGDDYWLSQHKLQQQYQIAKDNQVSVIFHSALELNMDNQDKKVVSRQQNYDGFIPLKDSVLGRGYFMPTASLFFHAKIIKERLYWFENDWPIGDFFLQMILSYEGKIYYIDEPMCLYRRNAQGSWTHKQKQKSEAIRFNHAMVSGIMKLYRLLGDRERKHLLAYPAFFYSKRLAYEKGEPILSIIWTASSVFLWDVSWSFKALYFMNAVYLPFSIVFRKIRNFQKLISRAL
ncbi:MAG TPA: glycosyltransferase [Proteobacteria bacterium]|nr:glycosyltransferase [Pseudomonadota bacterium]